MKTTRGMRRAAGVGLGVAGVVCVCAGVPAGALADVQLAPVFSSGMVLQQNAEARVWGFARAGERVVVTGSWTVTDAGGAAVEAIGETVADARGWWGVTIPTPPASSVAGPVTVTVAGDNTLMLSDVLIGEVWLASGQSNMEWSVAASAEPERALAEADGIKVRFFQVENAFSLHRRAEANGAWVASSAASAGKFSAVAFHFAREVSAKLGVPVGVIQADWGGTPIQAWTSEGSLAGFPQYAAALKQQAILRDPATRVSLTGDMEAKWWAGLDGLKGGAGPKWMTPEFDDSAWGEATHPSNFAGELAGFDGVVYARRTVELPADAAGKEGVLELGPVDDRDEAWVNGVLVGGTRGDNQWSVNRVYGVPEGVLRAGKNVVSVRVLDTGGLGGFGGKPEQMRLSWGGTTVGAAGNKSVSLAGAWRQKAGAAKADWPAVDQAPNVGPSSPGALFNAMIAPLTPMALAGVIWYQGESNVGDAGGYEALFKAFIADWRGAFARSDLPVGFVQIAPFEYTRFMPISRRAQTPDLVARLREAQARTTEIRRTGMVVTLDVGDAADIHPRDKRTVGRRLAAWALGEVYGVSDAGGVAMRSPAFKSASFEGASAVVTFSDTGGGLVAGAGAKAEAVPGFVLAGDDTRFVPATGRIDGERVVVTAPGVTRPMAVRYAWDESPSATLVGKNGLPVGPFRSDTWAWGGYTTQAPDVREHRTKEAGYVDLFNGKDLAGWANINTAPSTWSVKAVDGEEPVIACTGKPTGLLRTDKMYENFVLELEWRHLESGGNAGLFVWSDAMTARGQPFTRSVEVQVMDGLEGEWYTSDGDIFPIHGATMTPENPRGSGGGGNRAFPTERRVRPSPEWNHYRVECVNGDIALAVNGKVVTRGKAASPRKGYICLESEGSPVEFRAIRIKELPGSGALTREQTAKAAEGFVPLYNGVDFEGWKFTDEHKGHWKADDWTITFDGQGTDLWTEKSYSNFVLVCDWRWTGPGVPTRRPVILADGTTKKASDGKDEMVEVLDAGDSGIYLRGSSKSQVNMWCWPIGSGEVYGYRTDAAMPAEVRAGVTPREVADAPIGQWNRFVITMKGELLTVELNGKTVIKEARLPGVAAEGPIALQMHGSPIQFANIYIRELPASER